MTRKLCASAAVAALLLAAAAPAFAQTSSTSEHSPSGTTSGPASGSPTTLGSGGTAPASPHQLGDVKNQSSSVTKETEHSGSTAGSGSSSGTHETKGPAAEKPAASGTEGGPAPKDGASK